VISPVFEDNHLLVLIKRPGQTVQPEPGKPKSLEVEAKEYIKEKYQKPGAVFLGVVHRLDMPVGGLVVFARTSKALTRLNEIFQKREVKKTYQTWVENKPKQAEGLLQHWLKRDEKKNFTKAFGSPVKDALEAKLSYKVLKTEGNVSLLEVDLHTGRKHQIRAQLSAMGHPIVGDAKYGAKTVLSDGSILLQATKLSFEHPVSKEILNLIIGELKFPNSSVKSRV
jgi:23S rRNA pseudouridine1911/1915/1917 synthase